MVSNWCPVLLLNNQLYTNILKIWLELKRIIKIHFILIFLIILRTVYKFSLRYFIDRSEIK